MTRAIASWRRMWALPQPSDAGAAILCQFTSTMWIASWKRSVATTHHRQPTTPNSLQNYPNIYLLFRVFLFASATICAIIARTSTRVCKNQLSDQRLLSNCTEQWSEPSANDGSFIRPFPNLPEARRTKLLFPIYIMHTGYPTPSRTKDKIIPLCGCILDRKGIIGWCNDHCFEFISEIKAKNKVMEIKKMIYVEKDRVTIETR